MVRKFIFTLLRVLEKNIWENGWEYLSEFLDVRYVKRDKQCVCHTMASLGKMSTECRADTRDHFE